MMDYKELRYLVEQNAAQIADTRRFMRGAAPMQKNGKPKYRSNKQRLAHERAEAACAEAENVIGYFRPKLHERDAEDRYKGVMLSVWSNYLRDSKPNLLR